MIQALVRPPDASAGVGLSLDEARRNLTHTRPGRAQRQATSHTRREDERSSATTRGQSGTGMEEQAGDERGASRKRSTCVSARWMREMRLA